MLLSCCKKKLSLTASPFLCYEYIKKIMLCQTIFALNTLRRSLRRDHFTSTVAAPSSLPSVAVTVKFASVALTTAIASP